MIEPQDPAGSYFPDCDHCHRDPSDCVCPECPTCGVQGAGVPCQACAVNEEERRIIVHALTGGRPVAQAFRNYYAVHREMAGHLMKDGQPLMSLVQRGFLVKSDRPSGACLYYHVTTAGAAAVGLTLPPPF